MEQSVSKRRKLSPATSVRASESASNINRPRFEGNNQTKSVPQSSYLSPTKASLARYHPEILRRSGSAEPRKKQIGEPSQPVRRAKTEERSLRDTRNALTNEWVANSALPSYQLNGLGSSPQNKVPTGPEDTPSKVPRATLPHKANPSSIDNRKFRTPTSRRRRPVPPANDATPTQEPSLPSTPSQLGLEAPLARPRGLLFYTPSKRSRLEGLRERDHDTADHEDPFHESTLVSEEQMVEKLGERTDDRSSSALKSQARTSTSSSSDQLLRRLDVRLKILQHSLTRSTLHSKEKDRESTTKKDIVRSKRQLSKDAHEVMRLRATQEPESRPQQEPEPKKHPDRSAFSRLASFMPFCQVNKINDRYLDSSFEESQPPVEGQSRLSIDLTEPSDLITFQDRVEVMQNMELHTKQGVEILKMQIHVNTASQIVSKVTALHLAPWASQELNHWFIDDFDKPLAAISEVLHRYMELTTLRSNCWTKGREAFPALVGNGLQTSSEISQFGRQYLRLSRGKARLTVKWRILLDEQDSLQSDISLDMDVPTKWRQFDSKNDLAKIEEVFRQLVERVGVAQATQTIARALFPT